MSWEECMKLGMVEKRTPDEELAKSLLKIAGERFDFFYSKNTSIFAMEGIYEAILELSHAFLALEGLKTLSHECAIDFLRGKYLDEYETDFLQKMRKKRHGVKYYGTSVSFEILKANMEKGRALFLKLKTILEGKIIGKKKQRF